MNCTVSRILNIKRLISISRGVHTLSNSTKNPKQLVSKFSRLTCNGGCLVAGCCFSRQTEEEPLLSDVNKEDILNFNINKSEQFSGPNFNDRERSAVLKRKVESSDEAIDHENNLGHATEPICKRSKTSVESVEQIESAQQKHIVKDSTHSTGSSKVSYVQKPSSRPNYFVAIKISDDKIHESLKKVQDHILEQDDRLKKTMTELRTLHITLMVMHINDPETHARAMEALENLHMEYDKNFSSDPLYLEFKGLGHFQNRVLYAKLTSNPAYERLCCLVKSVKDHFGNSSIISTDKREHFTPHLTVAKIDFKKCKNLVKKIDPSLYEDFNDCYFGTQKVESIQLLSMTNPKTEGGYYSGDEIYFSAFNPSNRISCLNKLLSVEEKKKNVREVINALAKEKFK